MQIALKQHQCYWLTLAWSLAASLFAFLVALATSSSRRELRSLTCWSRVLLAFSSEDSFSLVAMSSDCIRLLWSVTFCSLSPFSFASLSSSSFSSCREATRCSALRLAAWRLEVEVVSSATRSWASVFSVSLVRRFLWSCMIKQRRLSKTVKLYWFFQNDDTFLGLHVVSSDRLYSF